VRPLAVRRRPTRTALVYQLRFSCSLCWNIISTGWAVVAGAWH